MTSYVRMVAFVLPLLAGTAAAQVPSTEIATATAETPSAEVLWQKMAADIGGVAQALDGVLGVAILDLTDGREMAVNGDRVFPTASTIKLAVLAELYRQTRQAESGAAGRLRLDERYVVRAEDRVPDSAIFNNLTPAVTTLTYRDLAVFMVVVSDNAATNVLIDRLGMDNVNQLLDQLGLKQTRLQRKMMDVEAAKRGRENLATPRELVRLLQKLRGGSVLGEAHTRDYFLLLRTPKESDLPRGVPETVAVANKPGSLPGVRCDAGVVDAPNRPFAIAVMTAYLDDDRAGSEAIAKVSAIAYRCFERLGAASVHGRYLNDRPSR